MKKLALLCSLWIIIAGCSTQTDHAATTTDTTQTQSWMIATETWTQSYVQLTGIRYSNMTDAQSQAEVKNALLKADVSQTAVQAFFAMVDDFTKIVEWKGLNHGFTRAETLTPEYDSDFYQQQRNNIHQDFMGYNCRITAFSLLQDAIKIKDAPETEIPENLMFDMPGFRSTLSYTKEKDRKFVNFFAQIPTTATATQTENIQKVKNTFAQKGVEFLNTKASLISVFFHDVIDPSTANLFIGHIGVLVPSENGELLFIEKIAFDQPYQAVKFKNRAELNGYLMGKYDVDYSGEGSRPFIFENWSLMADFQLNPATTQQLKANLQSLASE